MKQLVKIYFLFIFLFVYASNSFAGGVKTPQPQNTIKFTENKNQWDKKVIYRAQLDGGALFLEKMHSPIIFMTKKPCAKAMVIKEKT